MQVQELRTWREQQAKHYYPYRLIQKGMNHNDETGIHAAKSGTAQD